MLDKRSSYLLDEKMSFMDVHGQGFVECNFSGLKPSSGGWIFSLDNYGVRICDFMV